MKNNPPIRHVALWGLGAVGTMLTARILPALQSGETFCVIADADRVARYRRNGPVFNGETLSPDYALAGEERHGTDSTAVARTPMDLILLAVKARDLSAATVALAPFMAPHTQLLPLLNGITARDLLAQAFGEDHALDGLLFCNSAMRQERAVTQNGAMEIQLGEAIQPPVPTPRVQRVADWLKAHQIPVTLPPDMRVALWRKFMLNVGLNQAEAATGLAHGALLADSAAMQLLHELIQEAVAIATAEGIPHADALAIEAIDALRLLTPDGKTSMLQDIEAHRPPEVELFAGTIVQLGQKHRLPTPANQRILDRFRNDS